jgi:hypothetical protein
MHAAIFEKALRKAETRKDIDDLVKKNVPFIQYKDRDRCQGLLADKLAWLAAGEKK